LAGRSSWSRSTARPSFIGHSARWSKRAKTLWWCSHQDALRVRFVRDEAAFEGPLAGCRAGLEHARGEYAALLGADMPGVTGALISLMASRAGEARAIVLSDGDAPRPLPAVVHVASALALARSLIERDERRLRALVDGLGAESLAEAVWRAVDPAGAWRQDVDAPGDLAPRRT